MILPVDQLHPTYREIVSSTLLALVADYPACPLREVTVRRGPPNDRSLGSSDVPGVIQLNAYWFTDRSLDELREEARTGYLIQVLGSEDVIRWHGGMVEPQHLLAHEFFHQLSDVLAGVEEWSLEGWRAATMRPAEAVSGYALANPVEWFAEACAAAWLNVDHPSARAAGDFLARAANV